MTEVYYLDLPESESLVFFSLKLHSLHNWCDTGVSAHPGSAAIYTFHCAA